MSDNSCITEEGLRAELMEIKEKALKLAAQDVSGHGSFDAVLAPLRPLVLMLPPTPPFVYGEMDTPHLDKLNGLIPSSDKKFSHEMNTIEGCRERRRWCLDEAEKANNDLDRLLCIEAADIMLHVGWYLDDFDVDQSPHFTEKVRSATQEVQFAVPRSLEGLILSLCEDLDEAFQNHENTVALVAVLDASLKSLKAYGKEEGFYTSLSALLEAQGKEHERQTVQHYKVILSECKEMAALDRLANAYNECMRGHYAKSDAIAEQILQRGWSGNDKNPLRFQRTGNDASSAAGQAGWKVVYRWLGRCAWAMVMGGSALVIWKYVAH